MNCKVYYFEVTKDNCHIFYKDILSNNCTPQSKHFSTWAVLGGLT